jgi:predicted pyridoxine 5'-phosphate oxidase superfamily flavin-nucleotide-binding protein
MTAPTSDVAFTEAVKALQSLAGSRAHYAKMEEEGGWRDTVTDELAQFIAERDSFYLGTATAEGQPYIQHRGGPKGFLKVVDEKTLAFADYVGNRQYITAGNLTENDKAYIFLMDYPNRRRIKIWGRARGVHDKERIAELFDKGYKAKPQAAIEFVIEAWDVNCPQHITPRLSEAELAPAIEKLHTRIAELEAEVARLKRGA